jgi:predicted PurR-regulated permease PerM
MTLPSVKNRRKRSVGWQSRDVVRAAALVLGLYFLGRLFWLVHPLFLTAFLGVLFGLAVSSGVDWLQRWRIPRGIGAPLIVVAFLGLLIGFGAAVAPTLRVQGVELRRKLPEAIDRLDRWIETKQNGPLAIAIKGNPTIDSVAPTAAPVTPDTSHVGVAPTAGATADSTQTLRQRIGVQLNHMTKYLFPVLSSTIEVVAGLLIIIFMSIYIAIDPGLYHRGLMGLFPHRHRKRVGEVLTAIAAVLRRWLVTQLIAMLVMGMVTTSLLLILHVKAAFALGVLSGLLEFVPTVGALISSTPAIAMGFLDSPQKAVYVTLAYIAIHFLESHTLIPLLMKGRVNLPPALTIITQALMALLFGFLGLMCAVPLLAAGNVAVKLLYVEGVIGDPEPMASGPPQIDIA